MMKRLAVLLVVTGAVVALVVLLRPRETNSPTPPAAIGSPSATTAVSLPARSPSPTRPPHYRAGSVVTSEMTDYGLVRVRVTVARGRITAAHAIEIPDAVPLDVQLSRPAVKTLEQAVLATQGADVDMVSGATFTSTGYLASVQAALDQLS